MNNFFSRFWRTLPLAANFKSKNRFIFEIFPLKPRATIASVKQLFMRFPLQDKILFIKQLAILIRAGVPLFSSLHIIKKQSKSKSINKIMDQVIKDVENGQYLATALGKFKKNFGELTVNVIAIGEISGTLGNNLEHLVVSLKKKHALRRKIITASVYPIFIVIATLAITVMLVVFVFPKILPIFKSINYQLPWTTKFLIFISNSAQNHGLFIFFGIVIFIIGVLLSLKIKKIHFWYDKILISSELRNSKNQLSKIQLKTTR